MVPVDRPKTKEQFASREKIRKWKSGLKPVLANFLFVFGLSTGTMWN
jgi:hypothetical protein